MLLSSLSLEIWFALASRLHAADFWALLACGDPLLIHKLRSCAILTSIDMNQTNYTNVIAAMAHINLNKLRSLSVDVCAHSVLTHPSVIAQLPSLARFEWIAKLSTGMPSWEMQFVPHTYRLEEVDIASVMPALEHFSFHLPEARNTSYEGRPRFKLPESLTSLIFEMEPRQPNLHSPFFDMPPHLTRLYCHGLQLLSEVNLAEVLPRTLTALGGTIVTHHAAFQEDGTVDPWRRLAEQAAPNGTLEMRVSAWLSCERLVALLNCDDPVWRDYVPPEHDSYLYEVMEFHAMRFKGWGSIRLLPNLVELSVSAIPHDGEDDLFELVPIDMIYLPSNITALETTQYVCTSKRSLWWPPNITSIKNLGARWNSNDAALISAHHVEDFYVTLQSLAPHKVSPLIADYSFGTYPIDAAFFNSLSQYLTKLSITVVFSVKDIGLFPKTLTYLKLASHSPRIVINDDVMEATRHFSGLVLRDSGIPISQISDVELKSRYALKLETVPSVSSLPLFWPPSLATLILPRASTLLLDILPKSLTHYEFDQVTVTDGFFKHVGDRLPWLLRIVSTEHLKKAVERYYDSREGRYIGSVEFHLSSLSLPHLYAHTESLNLDFCKELHVSSLAGFTRLRSIESTALITFEGAPLLLDNLPPMVESIKMAYTGPQINDSILLKVPPHIRRLRIATLAITLVTVATTFASGAHGSELNETTLKTGFVGLLASFGGRIIAKDTPLKLYLTPSSSLSFPSIITSIDLPTDTGDRLFYVILPPALTSLRVVKSLCVLNGALSSLPSTLLNLEFSEDNSLIDEFVPQLPTLRALRLPRNSKLTSVALNRLPSTLQTLNLHSAVSINDTGIASLPSSITDLDISWASISSLALLPRGLTALDIANCESVASGDPSALPRSLTSLRAPTKLLEGCSLDILPHLASSKATTAAEDLTGLFDS